MEKQPLFWLGPFPLDGKGIFPTFSARLSRESANIMRLFLPGLQWFNTDFAEEDLGYGTVQLLDCTTANQWTSSFTVVLKGFSATLKHFRILQTNIQR